MKMQFTIVGLLCALGLSLAGAVNATPLLSECSASPASGLPCYSLGNDKVAEVEDALFDATGSPVDLTLYGKSDDDASLFTITAAGDNKSGTWLVNDGSLIDYLTVKASNRFAVYHIGGADSGSWTTDGIVNNGGQQPGMSHLSFWIGPSTVVPEPPALLMLGVGLIGMAFFARKKSR